MAKKNEKVNKSIKADKRSKVILGIVLGIVVLIIIAFFVHLSGLLPRMLTGIKITETVNGQQRVIENVSVAETAYQYNSVAQQYSQYGMFTADTIDDVMDPTTGKTYRQWLIDQAAEKLKNLILVNRAAEQDGYLVHSGAEAYADYNIDSLRTMSGLYGYNTLESYLQRAYGPGMNTSLLRECMIRETLAQEYQQYIAQFGHEITDEEIQAAFDQNPSAYQLVDYCIYYFAGEHLEDGSVDPAEAIETANAVADAATDPDSFLQAVIDNISEEDALAAGLITPAPEEGEEDADAAADEADVEATTEEEEAEPVNPLFHEGETATSVTYGAEGLSDFLFESGEIGSATVLTSDYGAYAVLLTDRHLYDEATVTYRSFMLNNETRLENGATPEEVDAAYQELIATANAMIANPLTSLEFTDLVKEHSTSSSGIIYGGLTPSVTMSAYEVEDDSPRVDQIRAEGAWLFDPARQHGDVYLSLSADQRTVTVIYFERNEAGWQDQARTQISNTYVSEWAQSLNVNAPSYLVSYDLIERLG